MGMASSGDLPISMTCGDEKIGLADVMPRYCLEDLTVHRDRDAKRCLLEALYNRSERNVGIQADATCTG